MLLNNKGGNRSAFTGPDQKKSKSQIVFFGVSAEHIISLVHFIFQSDHLTSTFLMSHQLTHNSISFPLKSCKNLLNDPILFNPYMLLSLPTSNVMWLQWSNDRSLLFYSAINTVHISELTFPNKADLL